LGIANVAEAVAAKHYTGVEHDAIPERSTRIDGYVGI
jgi:hypothetical protein